MAYKVSYPEIPNAGDLLNKYICKNIFGKEIVSSKPLFANYMFIGSGLGNFQYSNDSKKRFIQKVLSPFTGEFHVWSSGFIKEESTKENNFYKKNMEIHAVRGELTRRRLEKILDKKLDIPTCDGGILTSHLFDKPINKKYKLGIIPHFKEQTEKEFLDALNLSDNSIMIDLRKDPMYVFKQIAECEYILSSSLHGLIIADSFNIPNKHIVVTNKLMGDGFKFKDYYSSFGIKHVPHNVKTLGLPNINNIIDDYKITEKEVYEKQKQLYDSFPIK